MKSWFSKVLALALLAFAFPVLAAAAGHKAPHHKHHKFTKHSQAKHHR